MPFGKGHVVLFSINPVWRSETQGTYSLVLNTVMNYDSLNAGRKDEEKCRRAWGGRTAYRLGLEVEPVFFLCGLQAEPVPEPARMPALHGSVGT
jgi:hypothetical protein